MVGDARALFLPDLSAFRRGCDRLCQLRLVHTHLNRESISEDDLTDLALLRLDVVAAIEMLPDGMPGVVTTAHLLPNNDGDRPWLVSSPVTVHELTDDFSAMIAALDEEFARHRRQRRAGDRRDRAIVVHVSTQSVAEADDSISELRELARSAGIEVVHEIVQRRPIDPRYVMGEGRLRQTVIKAMQLGVEILVFDRNLTPGQVRGLANYTDLKILDRTQVILDIFAQRAETREGKIQVELAQLRYLLPRLSDKHTALSRLTGGIGGRGPGETKLEINQRRVKARIACLEQEVAKLGEVRRLRRRLRSRKGLPVVSIVGYTNVGKSTLLNNLTESRVTAQDVLFATLNPVSRRLRFPREREIIITDTVGFIRELPAELMAAFRTTLEELDEADLIMHMVDASRRDVDSQWTAVTSLLSELGLRSKPVLLVLNKADICQPDILDGLIRKHRGIPVCALDRSTFGPLLQAMEEALWPGDVGVVPLDQTESTEVEAWC
jgi:GTP-binding protein HflX